MTILDAYALVALLSDEPAAEEVERLVNDGEAAVTPLNLAEAIDVTRRVHRLDPTDVHGAIDPMLGERLELLAHGRAEVWRASDLRARYYHRRSTPVSLADCFLLAAAESGDRIATADPPVARVARAEGIEVVALPDSTGRRP